MSLILRRQINTPKRQKPRRRQGFYPAGATRQTPRAAYLILASRKVTCLRATGSYFLNSSLPVWARVFFFVT
jgi:hypothetical protein